MKPYDGLYSSQMANFFRESCHSTIESKKSILRQVTLRSTPSVPQCAMGNISSPPKFEKSSYPNIQQFAYEGHKLNNQNNPFRGPESIYQSHIPLSQSQLTIPNHPFAASRQARWKKSWTQFMELYASGTCVILIDRS